MMKQKRSYFIKKEYLLPLLFTAVLSFGYLVTHEAIGIDDTAIERYLEEGLEPVMGRWVLFVINRLLQVGSFAPFVTEAVSVLLLMGSVTLWMEVFRRVLEERVEIWCYTFAACIFLSSPILSEVYTYYLHNGISLAYGFAAAAAEPASATLSPLAAAVKGAVKNSSAPSAMMQTSALAALRALVPPQTPRTTAT